MNYEDSLIQCGELPLRVRRLQKCEKFFNEILQDETT